MAGIISLFNAMCSVDAIFLQGTPLVLRDFGEFLHLYFYRNHGTIRQYLFPSETWLAGLRITANFATRNQFAHLVVFLGLIAINGLNYTQF